MPKFLFLTFVIMLLIACKNNNQTEDIINIASQFAMEKLDSATLFTDPNGVVSVGDTLVRYVINPGQIYSGEIAGYSGTNILITIDSLHDPFLMPAYHLLLNSKLETLEVIRSDMRILAIEDGLIRAEIPTHEPSSPLYYCSECRDTVRYKLTEGQLILQ